MCWKVPNIRLRGRSTSSFSKPTAVDGAGGSVRDDNRLEPVSSSLGTWASTQGIALTCIRPGKPQQNACVERFNRTVRHEWPGLSIFDTIAEVPRIATEWLWTVNNERSNMGIGGITPAMKPKMAAQVLRSRLAIIGEDHRVTRYGTTARSGMKRQAHRHFSPCRGLVPRRAGRRQDHRLGPKL